MVDSKQSDESHGMHESKGVHESQGMHKSHSMHESQGMHESHQACMSHKAWCMKREMVAQMKACIYRAAHQQVDCAGKSRTTAACAAACHPSEQPVPNTKQTPAQCSVNYKTLV